MKVLPPTTSRYYLQILAILSGSITYFTSGVQYAWTSPYIPLISSKEFPGNITFEEASYFTVIPPIGFLIFGPIFSSVVEIIGRKNTLLIAAPLQLAAYICIYCSTSLVTFYMSRFLTGAADAVCWAALPAYVGEICQPHVRGTWGNLPSILMYLGEVLILVFACFLDFYTNTLVLSLFPIICFFTFVFMPESPYYYLTKGKHTDAHNTLAKFRGSCDVSEELIVLTKNVKEQLSQKGTFKELFTVECNRKALFVVLGARAANQFSGIGAFTVYAQFMFEKAGQQISDEMSAIVFMGCLFVFCTIFCFFLEKFGRRTLMIVSCSGCTVTLLLETIYFYLDQYTNINLSQISWFPLVFMVVYLFFFSSGLAVIPFIILSELFAANVKSKAIAISNIFFAVCLIFVPKLFQLLIGGFGLFEPFLFFSLCTFLSSLFSYYYVPETKGKTLQQIQKILQNR